jgi:hypothetical protein
LSVAALPRIVGRVLLSQRGCNTLTVNVFAHADDLAQGVTEAFYHVAFDVLGALQHRERCAENIIVETVAGAVQILPARFTRTSRYATGVSPFLGMPKFQDLAMATQCGWTSWVQPSCRHDQLMLDSFHGCAEN